MEDNKVIREYDEKGNVAYYKNSDGYEKWYEYDEKGNETHTRHSDGYEVWKEYDEKGNETHTRYSDGYEVWVSLPFSSYSLINLLSSIFISSC